MLFELIAKNAEMSVPLNLQVFAPARLPAPSRDTAASLAQVLSDVTAGYVDLVSPAGAQPLGADDLARDSGAVIQQGILKVGLELSSWRAGLSIKLSIKTSSRWS